MPPFHESRAFLKAVGLLGLLGVPLLLFAAYSWWRGDPSPDPVVAGVLGRVNLWPAVLIVAVGAVTAVVAYRKSRRDSARRPHRSGRRS